MPARPALLPSVAWLLGAGAGAAWQPSPRLALALAVALALLGALIAVRWHRPRHGVVALLAGAGLLVVSHAFHAHRARTAALFDSTEEVRETEVVGTVARATERSFDGTRVLWVTGRVGAAGRLAACVRLRIAASNDGAWLDDLVRGDRVRVWCRLRRPSRIPTPDGHDPASAWAARGIEAQGSVKSARLLVVEAPGAGIRAWIDRLRSAARRRLDRSFGSVGPLRGLIGAMLLGDRELLEPGPTRDLRDAGLVHVVAISGLQVGLVAIAVTGLARRSRLPRWIALPASLAALFLFGELVGAAPSVLRAIGAVILLQAGRTIGRDGDALNSLALVGAVLVALAPCSIADPGLQLSLAATWGLIAGARPVAERLPLPRLVALSTGATIGAYLATAPIAAHWFGRLAPIGALTNLAAAPLSATALGFGYPAIAAAELPLLGPSSAWAAALPNRLLLTIAARSASVRQATLVVGRPSFWTTAFVYATLAWVWHAPRRDRPLARRLALAGLAVGVLWLHIAPAPRASAGELEGTVLDVGQAQAVALRARGGEVVLIDAAGSADPRFDPGERIVVPWLVDQAAARVAILSVSHEHADHAGGAFAILRDLEVGQVWLPIGWQRSQRLVDLAAFARERGAAIVLAERGYIASAGALRVEVLGPARRDADLTANDRSIVLRAGSAPCRILVPGDLDPPGERSLVEADHDLTAEALVVPHHGSRNGSSPALLERVSPAAAIVSCGRRNRFGHPHVETLARLNGAGIHVWRTDQDGTVRLRCESWGFEIVRARQLAAGPE